VIAVAAGAIAYRSWTTPTVEESWAAAQPVEKLPAQEMVKLAGRVVRPDGSAAAGAKVACISHYPSDLGEAARTTTAGADGTFELPVPRAELAVLLGAGREVSLVASAEDCGLAWRSAAAFLPQAERSAQSGAQQAVLKLVEDETLAGHVKTAAGLPAAGVRFELLALWTNDGEDLEPWLKAVAKGEAFGKATWGRMNRYLAGQGLDRFAVTTDADGRFRLPGLG
jgi:hypothetical protein